MRIAVLSDVHAVLPALEAVLAEPDVASADRIVLTGDLAAGPQPVETLDLLSALAESSYPDAREWGEYYIRSVAGDADAIEAMGPRDGRGSASGEVRAAVRACVASLAGRRPGLEPGGARERSADLTDHPVRPRGDVVPGEVHDLIARPAQLGIPS